MSAAMKRVSGTVYNILDCSLRTTPTCDSDFEVCGVWSVNQVLRQHLSRPEEEPEQEEEVAEHKATLFDALKGMEAARKCIYQFDTKNNIIVMCNKVETELYTVIAQGEKKQKTDWFKK
jgi:hypothetical protein